MFQDAFAGLDDEKDEDLEIETMVADYKKRGGSVLSESMCLFMYFIVTDTCN